MVKIYIVEDDENIRELIKYALNTGGYQAIGFRNADELYDKISTEIPDMFILDIMLEGEDGYSILEKIRNRKDTRKTPVIMLTAKDGEYDKVKGLDMGADDYITKPFGVMELISRIKAVLRRVEGRKKVSDYREISLNDERRIVKVESEEIDLTFKEFELLKFLIENQGIVLSRESIMNTVWGFDYQGESRTVDVHIRTLRQKLKDAGNYIITVRNVGYKIGD
ncbi:MAG: response regulator transcription factor [Tissierellia bacterium]|nr:response regulator transcription factor [Tissierellia bacterium]